MTLAAEAIARYHKLIESEPYIDLGWAQALQERKRALKLEGGPLSPVLRPHFLSTRDYAALAKVSSILLSAIQRVQALALSNASLFQRIPLLPAERMLSAAEPGYSSVEVLGALHANVNDGSLHFGGYSSQLPAGVVYGEALADLYYDAPPVKELRKKFRLKKLGGAKPLITAILKTYKEFGGKSKRPGIAIAELRQPHASAPAENVLLAEFFSSQGFPAEIVTPDQLEYRNGVLRRGEFNIDVVYRNVKLQEFLMRFDLNHALVRAYRDRAVCMINNFRAELGSKRAVFDLLTDESVTSSFPTAERKAIRDFVPWTRIVQAAKTTHKGHLVDLPEFVMKNRARLILRPNDEAAEVQTVRGAEVDDRSWEKALRQAMRIPSVVQEAPEPARAVFPM